MGSQRVGHNWATFTFIHLTWFSLWKLVLWLGNHIAQRLFIIQPLNEGWIKNFVGTSETQTFFSSYYYVLAISFISSKKKKITLYEGDIIKNFSRDFFNLRNQICFKILGHWIQVTQNRISYVSHFGVNSFNISWNYHSFCKPVCLKYLWNNCWVLNSVAVHQ